MTTLYEHGRNIACDSDNFVNLRNNLHHYLDYTSPNLTDFSYKYIGRVSSASQVRRLVMINMKKSPFSGISYSFPGYIQSGENKRNVGKAFLRFKLSAPEIRKNQKDSWKELAKTVSKTYVNKGDRIYKLSCRVGNKMFESYSFVDQRSNKIQNQKNFDVFGYAIPVSLFEEIDKF